MNKEETTVCCPSSRVVPSTTAPDKYTTKGKVVQLGKMDVYVVGSPSQGKAVVLIADVLGLPTGRHKAIADQLSDEGFYVVAPDLFLGDKIASFADLKTARMGEFLGSHPTDKWQPLMDDIYSHLKEQKVTKFGMIGFCWGTWCIFNESARKIEGMTGGACIHPAFGIEGVFKGDPVDLAKKVNHPMVVFACKDDPANCQPDEDIHKVLEKKSFGAQCEFVAVDQNHGFCSQGDITNDATKEAVSKSIEKSVAFFKAQM